MQINQATQILDRHYNQQLRAYNDFESKNWCELKYAHSFDVSNTMQELLKNENDLNFSDDFKERILCAALLHDVGRFYQMKNGVLQKDVKHGDLGRQILGEEIDDLLILLLIHHHDNATPSEFTSATEVQSLPPEEYCIFEKAWYAMRDCDMLANAIMMKRENNIYAMRDPKDTKAFYPGINDEMYSSVIEGRPFKGVNHLVTIYDSWAGRFSWLYSYRYNYSKSIHIKNGITTFLLSHLEELKKKSKSYGFDDFSSLNRQVGAITQALEKRNEL